MPTSLNKKHPDTGKVTPSTLWETSAGIYFAVSSFNLMCIPPYHEVVLVSPKTGTTGTPLRLSEHLHLRSRTTFRSYRSCAAVL